MSANPSNSDSYERENDVKTTEGTQYGMYDWGRLDFTPRMIRSHREWLFGIEDLLEEDTAERMFEIVNDLEIYSLRDRVATVILHVLREKYPWMTAVEIATATGVPKKKLLRYVKQIDDQPGDLREPEQFIRDRDELYGSYDDVLNHIAEYPDSFVYGGTQPNMVAAVAVREVCEFKRREVAEMFDVTGDGIYIAQQRKNVK